MKKHILGITFCAGVFLPGLAAQDIKLDILKGERPVIALPELRGSGEAQQLMAAFNSTLLDEIQGSGVFRVASKSLYPLQAPQQPQDLKAPLPGPPPRRGEAPRMVSQGPWLTDWSGPPVSATYLAFGYAAAQADRLVLNGWLYNVTQDISSAQVLGKVYLGSFDEAGAKKVAREFAADILKLFGAQSLAGTRIYYVSSRARGVKEVWAMDYDGSNQKQFTQYNSISLFPAVSPDGTKVAFTSFAHGTPEIIVHSTETGRRLPFYNQRASVNETPEFTVDSRQILFASTLSGFANLYIADLDGRNLRRLTNVRAVEVSPRVNPKTGVEIAFVSGRAGLPQIYRMNMDGADSVRLTPGEGEAANPAWHPDGKHLAFAWTRGFSPGNYNIFVMDVATQQYNQLTHGEGRNENPWWAPDGRHLVFSSTRSGTPQIYTMLADGTEVKRLTSEGRNETPVWGK